MKRFLPLLLVLIALVSACHSIHKQVPGSGRIQRETRDVGPFNSISTEGAFDLKIVCQKPQRLDIAGDDNVLPLVATEVSNHVLHIKNLRGYSTSEPVTLEISLPDLVGISASGAGNIEISGIKNESFVIDASGAPSIKAAGDTSKLNIDARGAGRIDAHKLHATHAVVESKGVGHVDVFASQQLDVTVSGPATVIYEGGAATVNKTVNGPGSVEKKESSGA
ncbi:MAG: hypothetical protein QOJ88_299 [Pyrinomonadaceae bacterium]|nr:hypothetical protein [Pyrinomonadaceae bacterium]